MNNNQQRRVLFWSQLVAAILGWVLLLGGGYLTYQKIIVPMKQRTTELKQRNAELKRRNAEMWSELEQIDQALDDALEGQ